MRFLFSLPLLVLIPFYSLASSEMQPVRYLSWDNSSEATAAELVADPLLIIRTLPSETTAIISDETSRKLSGRKRAGKIVIANTETHFEFTKPHFLLIALFPCTKINWQISTDPDFATIIPSLDIHTDFSDDLEISDLAQTFLDNDTVYYFRVKSTEGFVSNQWSIPFTFTLSKPECVQNLQILEEDNSIPLLAWDAHENPQATYYVFGSDTPDFIPSTASDTEMSSDEVITFAETAANNVPLDEQSVYFRVVTKINDAFSKPSPLIKKVHTKTTPLKNDATAAPYIAPASFPSDLWDKLSGYFLPEDSTQRLLLDQIFSKRRVLGSLKSMSRAGFILLTDPRHKIIVARHPKIPGYLFKVFLDTSSECEYHWWRKRINGVNTIQAAIDSHQYGHLMKTPKKWIYPLPAEPEAAEGTYPKHFILVVEEMDILKHEENRGCYRKLMTKERLDAYYTLLTELNLIDSVYADNTPFCKDGKMAFIDTEHAMDVTLKVPVSVVGQYLSPEMLGYWEQLITGGITH